MKKIKKIDKLTWAKRILGILTMLAYQFDFKFSTIIWLILVIASKVVDSLIEKEGNEGGENNE